MTASSTRYTSANNARAIPDRSTAAGPRRNHARRLLRGACRRGTRVCGGKHTRGLSPALARTQSRPAEADFGRLAEGCTGRRAQAARHSLQPAEAADRRGCLSHAGDAQGRGVGPGCLAARYRARARHRAPSARDHEPRRRSLSPARLFDPARPAGRKRFLQF